MQTALKILKTSMLIIMAIVAISLLFTVMFVFLGEKLTSTIMDIFLWCYISFTVVLVIGVLAYPGMMRKQGLKYKKLKEKEEKRRQKSQNEKRPDKAYGLFVRCNPEEKNCQRCDEQEHENEKKPPERREKQKIGQ